jgi:uncharacterized membrane protein YoaK (UPF0700 family)
MRDTLVLMLAFTAGSVDAISYLGLGNVFTANMTGNTVLLGIAVARQQGLATLRSLAALVGYLLGVGGGALLIGRAGKKMVLPTMLTTIFAFELIILAALTLAAIFFPPSTKGVSIYMMILFTAAAMGIQSVGGTALGIRSVATTYITGTWTGLISGLVRDLPVEQRDSAETPPVIGIQAGVLGIYLLAAVVGGLAATHWHLRAFVVPTIAIAAVVATAWWQFRRPGD